MPSLAKGRGGPEKTIALGQLDDLGRVDMAGVQSVELVLCVGAHRTATTSFHNFLIQNLNALRAEKLAFVGTNDTRAGLFTGMMCHPDFSTSEQDRRAHRACGLTRLMLAEKQRDGFEQILLSEPNLLGNIAENVTTGCLYPHAKARLMRARNGFIPNLKRITLSIRSYDTWWASQLAVSVAAGHSLPSEATLDRLITQPRRWKTLIEDIKAVFPGTEIMVLPYERVSTQPERVLALLTGVCIPDGIRAAREVHAMAPTQKYLRDVVKDRGETPQNSKIFDDGMGSWMPFPTWHSEALKEAYAEDLAWLREQDGSGLTFIDDHEHALGWDEDLRGQDYGFKEEYSAARGVGTTG